MMRNDERSPTFIAYVASAFTSFHYSFPVLEGPPQQILCW